jgi:hypothetical protein
MKFEENVSSPLRRRPGRQKDLSPTPASEVEFSIEPDMDKRGFAIAIMTAPEKFVIAGSNV